MFFKIINYSILFVCLLSLVFIIKKSSEDHSYIEVGYKNPNCASGPWAFCPEFYKLNEIIDHIDIQRPNGNYPFSCTQSAYPYCRRIGEEVLISVPFRIAKNLDKTDILGYQKCLVSNLTNNLDERKKIYPRDFIKHLNCKVLDSEKMSRYAKCAWTENKIMLVFNSPRAKISDLKNIELKLKSFDKSYIDIQKCFKGFQNNNIYNFWPDTKVGFE